MAESSPDQGADDPSAAAPPQAERRRAGKIGRRVALLVWAVAMTYVVVVGFATMIPQVFFDEPEAPAQPLEGDCDANVETLMASLLDRGGEHVAEARPAATLTPYFRRWDARFHAYQRRCGETREGADLARLRYRLELTLRRFDREEGAIVRRLDGR